MVCIHEGTRTVVDGLARDGGVIGIENTVNEANAHPAGCEVGQSAAHRVKKREVAIWCIFDVRVVPRNGVIRERAHPCEIPSRREILEGADPYVAGSNTREDPAW